MSNSRPVPACRLPNAGDRYHELYHGCPPSSRALDAISGWSPSDIPSGPKAAIPVTVSERCAGPVPGLRDTGGTAAIGDAPDGEAAVGWVTAGEVAPDAAVPPLTPAPPEMETRS